MPTTEAVTLSHPADSSLAHYVTACVNMSGQAASVVPHAFAIAQALGAPLTLLHVLEPRAVKEARPDPIEWDLRRHEARRALNRIASSSPPVAENAELALVEGLTADEICRFAAKHGDGLTVLGTRGRRHTRNDGIGGTVHNVLNRVSGSILLVPRDASLDPAGYRRLFVPIDGSCWAESVLPLAARVAKAENAELLLAHVVPVPELTETRPLELEDLLLRQRVVERNEEMAGAYLERIRSRLAGMGLRVRVLSCRGDDVRVSLARLIDTEGADLVVISAQGRGGSCHRDMRYGSVASYLMAHSIAPVLVVRPPPVVAEPSAAPEREVRLPVACYA
jgi:nucleotide-binding universal stress UspA family protein